MDRSIRQCGIFLIVLCLLVGLVPLGAFATESSDSGVEILCQQLILSDDLTMRFEIAIEDSVAEMADVKLAVGDAQTVYTVSELTPNESGNYLVSADVAAAQMTDTITVTVSVGEFEIVSKDYTVLSYAEQILNGNYGTATKALVKEMLNYGAKAQTYFDYKDGSLSEYETVTPVTMPTEAEAMSVEGSVDGIEFYGSSMLFTGKLAIRYYFTAPDGVESYTFTSGGNTYKADKKNDLYYVDVAGINPQDIDDAVVMTVSNESSSLSVGYGPMNYITRMYNGKGSEKLKNLLQALYGYHLAAEAFVESGETQEEIKELAIPEGAVLVSDFSTDPNPWNNPNWGHGAVGISNWYEEYDGVAGVQAFGVNYSADTQFTMWTSVLPLDFDYSNYTYVTIRLKASTDWLLELYLTDLNTDKTFLSEVTANGEWTTVTLNISEIPSWYLKMAAKAHASGELLWIDQVWVSDPVEPEVTEPPSTEPPVEELAIPEGAVLVSDFSTDPNPWNNPNWGHGAVGISNWYEEYDGVAGVQAFGVNYSADTQFTMWTNVLPLDFDYSNYTYVTLRLKASKDWLLELYLTDLSTDKTFLSDVTTNGEWTTVTLNISEIPSWYLKMAAKAHAGGELLWIDQVWVSDPVVKYPSLLPSYEQERDTKQIGMMAFWTPPVNEQQYIWMKEAGITSICLDNKYNAISEQLNTVLSMCDELEIDVFISCGREAAHEGYASNYSIYMDHPSFKGFYIDEPILKSQLDNIAGLYRECRKYNKQMVVNLLGGYSSNPEEYSWIFSNRADFEESVAAGEFFPDYDAYMSYFKQVIGSTENFILCATNYPLLDGNKGYSTTVSTTWLNDLQNSKERAAYLGAPLMLCVQATAFHSGDQTNYHRQPTESDIRWQYHTALAYGIPGFVDFVYTTTGKGVEFNEGDHGAIWWTDQNDYSTYYRTEVYYALQTIHEEITKFDHVLLSYNWQGIMVNVKDPDSSTGKTLLNTTNVLNNHKRIESISSSKNLLIGCFQDAQDYDGFLLVNFDETLNHNSDINTVSITFEGAYTVVVYVNGERQVVTLNNGVFNCDLEPGEAVFVIPVQGSEEQQINELEIPQGAAMVNDYASFESYNGVAGVMPLTNCAFTDTSVTSFDFAAYNRIVFRMKASKGATITVGGQALVIPNTDWNDISVALDSLSGAEIVVTGNVWIDQIYAQYTMQELALPKGAVLVNDFSTAVSPWNNPNWGSGAVGVTQWYKEFDGVAGVQAFGVNYSANTQFTMWTSVLPLDFDYSSYAYVTIRLKANKDWLLEVYMGDTNADKTFLSDISANNEWTTVTLKTSEIPSWYLKMAAKAHAGGELLWIDQVYVHN